MLRRLQPAFEWEIGDSLYPVRSDGWYRLHGPSVSGVTATWGMTTIGEGKKGYWHCPGCIKQWTWTELGEKRLLMMKLCDDDNEHTTTWFRAYVGDEMAREVQGFEDKVDLEAWIGTLKQCQLVSEVIRIAQKKDKLKTMKEWFTLDLELSLDILKMAIKNLNDKCEQAMRGHPNVITLNASDPAGSDQYYARQLYCEDARLSLPAAGVAVKALVIRRGDYVPTLTFEDLYEILSYVSCVYDISSYTPTKKAETKAYRQIVQNMGTLRVSAL